MLDARVSAGGLYISAGYIALKAYSVRALQKRGFNHRAGFNTASMVIFQLTHLYVRPIP